MELLRKRSTPFSARDVLKKANTSFKPDSIARRGTSMFLWRALAFGIGAGGSVWVTRCMGPANLGISAVVLAVCTQIGLFVRLNQDAHYIRLFKRSPDETEKHRLLAGAFTLRLVIAALATVIGLGVVLVFHLPPVWWLPICGGILLLFFDQNSPNWVLQAQENQPAQYRATALKCVVLTAVAVMLFRPGMRPGSDLLLTGISAAAAWIVAWYWALSGKWSEFPKLFDWNAMVVVAREIPRSVWLVVTGFVLYGYTQLQLPLLAYLRPFAEVGMFRSASSLTDVANSFFLMIPALLYPRYVEWNKKGSAYLWGRQLTLLRWLAAGIIPLSIATAVISPIVYPIVFGKAFAPAANCFSLLVIAKLVVILNGIFGWGLWSQGADRTNLVIMCATMVISIALNLLIIPRFGINGAAFVNFFSEVLILIGCMIASRRLVVNDAAKVAAA